MKTEMNITRLLLRSRPRLWRYLKITGYCCTVLYTVSFVAVVLSNSTNFAHSLVYQADETPSETTQPTMPQTTTPPYTGPMMVMILTYQRSGSTFLGQMFNRNPEAFYAFEPLDGLYSAIYGTSQGYNAPSDIFQYWNGSRRELPEFEVLSSATVLDSLLSCNHSELPTEMLTNIFWVGFQSEHLTVSTYGKCLTAHKIADNRCRASIRKPCKTWLGEKGAQQEMCRHQLWAETSPNNSPRQREFTAYKKCLAGFRKKASVCFPHLTMSCTHADIRSAKVVRLSMRAVEHLLAQHPDRLKVIHLLRDPKSVAVSRMKYESVRGHYAGFNKTAEALTLCRTMEDDLEVRGRLELKYPGVFFQVIYEDFIRDPVNMTRAIYSHIGKQLPAVVEQYFTSKTSLNSTKPLANITRSEADSIDHVCSKVYGSAGHRWPMELVSTNNDVIHMKRPVQPAAPPGS